MVAPVEYFETSFWSKSKEFRNHLAIYSSSCCQKFASHRRLLCLDFHWNPHNKNRSDRCFLWQTQAPTSKRIGTPALKNADHFSSSFFHAHWRRRKTSKHPALCRVQLTAGEVNLRLYKMVRAWICPTSKGKWTWTRDAVFPGSRHQRSGMKCSSRSVCWNLFVITDSPQTIHLLDLRCVSWLTPPIQPRQRFHQKGQVDVRGL